MKKKTALVFFPLQILMLCIVYKKNNIPLQSIPQAGLVHYASEE